MEDIFGFHAGADDGIHFLDVLGIEKGIDDTKGKILLRWPENTGIEKALEKVTTDWLFRSSSLRDD